jgi:RsiW-degrading membrane proteinase PrsW (M82 family)
MVFGGPALGLGRKVGGAKGAIGPGRPGQDSGAGIDFAGIKGRVDQAVNSITGDSGAPTITFLQLFSEVFQKHEKADMDALMVCGTAVANRIAFKWKRPWLFARVFLVLGTAFLLLDLCYGVFGESAANVLPGIIFTGSMVVPVALMVFFWEANEPRNISIFSVMGMFFVGGGLSVLLTFFTQTVLEAFSYGALSAGRDVVLAFVVGISEEAAKVAVVFLFASRRKGNWMLNGLLLGAVIGAGFAVFETAGYSMNAMFAGVPAMQGVIFQRGFLSVGGHVIWTAIAGAALFMVQRTQKVNASDLLVPRFFIIFAVPVALHSFWDLFAFTVANETVLWLLLVVLIVVGWIFVVKLINIGLREYTQGRRVAGNRRPAAAYKNQPSARSGTAGTAGPGRKAYGGTGGAIGPGRIKKR